MNIEKRLDTLIEKMDKLTAISSYIEGQMVDKVGIAELEDVVLKVSKHNEDSFVLRSEFNELKELVSELSLNIKGVKDEIPDNYLVADDLYDYADAFQVADLESRISELEEKLDRLEF